MLLHMREGIIMFPPNYTYLSTGLVVISFCHCISLRLIANLTTHSLKSLVLPSRQGPVSKRILRQIVFVSTFLSIQFEHRFQFLVQLFLKRGPGLYLYCRPWVDQFRPPTALTTLALIFCVCQRNCENYWNFSPADGAINLHTCMFKVNGPFVQTLCIEKESYMDAI